MRNPATGPDVAALMDEGHPSGDASGSALWRSVLDADTIESMAKIGHFRWDIASDRIEVSPSLRALVDVGVDDLSDDFHGAMGVLEPEQARIAFDHLDALVARGGTTEYEVTIRFQDDSLHRLHTTARLVRADSGAPVAVIGLVQDVTPQWEIQRRLEESELRLREAQHVGRIGSWEYEIGAHELAWSDEMFRVYGHEPGAFVPTVEQYESLLHPDDLAGSREAQDAALATGKPFDYTHRYFAPDGSTRWVRGRGWFVCDQAGKPTKVIGTAQDVTTERDAVTALARSEALLREAQEVAHIGSWSWDIDDDVITWSDELYRLFGLTPGPPAPGFEAFAAMIHEADRDAMVEVVAAAMEAREPFDFEHRIVRQDDGAVRWLHARGRVVLDAAGEPVRMVGTALDVTKHREAADAVEQARARLMEQEKLAALGTMVMGVAHELRTPMTYVRNNLHVMETVLVRSKESFRDDERLLEASRQDGKELQSDGPEPWLDTHLRERVGKCMSTVERCTGEALEGMRRIGEILDEVRTSYSADLAVERSEFCDLASVCEKAVRLTAHNLPQGVRVDCNLESCPEADAVSGQIMQVVVNLVNNAAEAMGDAGLQGAITVRTYCDSSSYYVEVVDEGPGLGSTDPAVLFEPFHTTKRTGTGLGLFLVKEIADRHGAAVEAHERQDGQSGAVFRLRLPKPAEGQGQLPHA